MDTNDTNTEVLLTTIDNPYNPFTDWYQWILFDRRAGYNTVNRLASICKVSDNLSDEENQMFLDDAMDQLIKTGAISKSGELVEYKKVYRTKEA